jgi:hypothetical protein
MKKRTWEKMLEGKTMKYELKNKSQQKYFKYLQKRYGNQRANTFLKKRQTT